MNREKLLFACLMALINASLISFVLTAYNIGFPPDFLLRWGLNFLVAFSIVVPSILFIGPQVNKIVKRMVTV